MEEDQVDIENIVKIAEELITVMDNDKIETDILNNILKEWQKIIEIRDSHKEHIKNFIQEMTEMSSAEEANYRKIETVYERISQEGQVVEQAVTQKKEELSNVKLICKELQQNLGTCHQEAQRLEIEKQEKDQLRKISIPKTRHDITLYKLITNLHFDLNTPPNQLKGYVCGSAEVKPFSLNKAQLSKYDIVNSLWDIIGEGDEDW